VGGMDVGFHSLSRSLIWRPPPGPLRGA
jgi:hypothetical protein